MEEEEIQQGIDLNFFVGKTFELTGVGSESVAHERFGDSDDSTHFSFVLDGNTFTAAENPNDGYRSSLGSLAFKKGSHVANTFEACTVVARKDDGSTGNFTNDIVEFVDVLTKRVVIEVGTRNTNDYYPCFVGHFAPQNMASNDDHALAKQANEAAARRRQRDADWGNW